MIYLLPFVKQNIAQIKFPKFRRPFCIAPKTHWSHFDVLKCPDTKRIFHLAGALVATSEENVAFLPSIVPYTEYGTGEVAFSPLYQTWRTSPKWAKERRLLFQSAPGQWIIEEWERQPRTCAECDPCKNYPDITWSEIRIKALLESVPTISTEEHPVWQKYLRAHRVHCVASKLLMRPPSFDDHALPAEPRSPEQRPRTREEFRRRAAALRTGPQSR